MSLVDDPLAEIGTLRIRGRPPALNHVEYTRDLTRPDLEALALPKGYTPQTISRLRASHHSLARCLATGMKHAQASLVTGYAQTTIAQLMTDPTFLALVEDYRQEVKLAFGNLAERMADLSLDAMEELQARLHDNPEGFTVPVLLDLIKSFADRTGFGPNQEVHLKVDQSSTIDRPPRESYEEWRERRNRELAEAAATITQGIKPPDKLN